jgi:hypothetical protein
MFEDLTLIFEAIAEAEYAATDGPPPLWLREEIPLYRVGCCEGISLFSMLWLWDMGFFWVLKPDLFFLAVLESGATPLLFLPEKKTLLKLLTLTVLFEKKLI